MGQWWYREVQYINCCPITQHYIHIYIYICPQFGHFRTPNLSVDPGDVSL